MKPHVESDVILVAHGAGDASVANRDIIEVARRAAISLRGVRVTAAFLQGSPSLAEAIRSVRGARCAVLPLLASEGYFLERVRALTVRAARERGIHSRLVLLRPIGSHRKVRTSLAFEVARAIEGRGWPSSRVTVVVLGHGTTRSPASAQSVQAAARAIASHTGARAVTAFLDQRPTIEAAVAALDSGRPVVMVPFLIGGGPHALDDVPSRVRATLPASGTPAENVVWLGPLGEHRWLPSIIRDAIRRFLKDPVRLRAGARRSELSQRQVALAAEFLSAGGLTLSHVPIDTPGDRDIATPLDVFADDTTFSADIDDALLAGAIDVAVHSLKDLPQRGTAGIVTATVLPRGPAEDVLVTRDHQRLTELRAGAVVGTSSRRRAAQVLRLRPDLVARPIRGSVPARLEQLARGAYDALILAGAGLERLGLAHAIAERFAVEEIVPAPGQGTIVVQCCEDSPFRALLARLSDVATARAMEAELRFAAELGRGGALQAAAVGSATADGVRLRARAIDLSSGCMLDTTVTGEDPDLVGAEAARQLIERGRGVAARESA